MQRKLLEQADIIGLLIVIHPSNCQENNTNCRSVSLYIFEQILLKKSGKIDDLKQ